MHQFDLKELVGHDCGQKERREWEKQYSKDLANRRYEVKLADGTKQTYTYYELMFAALHPTDPADIENLNVGQSHLPPMPSYVSVERVADHED